MFPYRWYLKDGYNFVEQHHKKVFSCFSCGGGSTMGYKMAGYDVIGCNDIDKRTIELYKINHKPKYIFNNDIRDLIELDNLPNELYNLDILDGSPPCSTFSVAGEREKTWGKEKVFREGQSKQTLDDLFFYFIKLVNKLKPKIVIAENVKGLIIGNAKGYVKQIIEEFNKINYTVQVFLLNGASMGLPQKRERIFFIGQNNSNINNINNNKTNNRRLVLSFKQKPILFKEIMDINDTSNTISKREYELWLNRKYGEHSLADTNRRLNGKYTSFNCKYIYSNKVVPTIVSSGYNILYDYPRFMNKKELCLASSFPLDYNFLNEKPKYIMGMAVPPIMMANISYEIYKQLLS